MSYIHFIHVYLKITFHKSVMFDYYIISYISFIISSFIYVKLLDFRVRAENLLVMSNLMSLVSDGVALSVNIRGAEWLHHRTIII